jgi:hypothetical protein
VLNCLAADRPAPSEAARILRPRQYIYVAPVPPLRPPTVVASNPGDGPFGPFPSSPPRRLDGTLYAEPPWHVSFYVGRLARHHDTFKPKESTDERGHLRSKEQ